MKVLAGQAGSELIQRALGAALIGILCSWLYYPYLSNPLVFDDSNLFHTEILTTAAIAPWELGIRGLPYFTLGWVETQIGGMEAHRSVSLALHILVAYQMCRFLEEVLIAGIQSTPTDKSVSQTNVRWIAVLIAAAFACHPVAVYGAGYLVQRTIVFATLFALICLRNLLFALRQNDVRAALRAAVWASLSILSKQHAVMLPIAALALTGIVHAQEAKVGIGISGWTGFAPLTLAKEAGIFKKNGLDVEIKMIPQKDRHLALASKSSLTPKTFARCIGEPKSHAFR